MTWELLFLLWYRLVHIEGCLRILTIQYLAERVNIELCERPILGESCGFVSNLGQAGSFNIQDDGREYESFLIRRGFH